MYDFRYLKIDVREYRRDKQKMENPEKLATPDEDKQNKNTT